MHSYNTEFSNVGALLTTFGIELRSMDRDQMMGEYGNVVSRCLADNWINYLDAGDLRLIVRQLSDQDGRWFEVEIGKLHDEADSLSKHSEHHVRVIFMERSAEDSLTSTTWEMDRDDTPEAKALLKEINPKLADLCWREKWYKLRNLPDYIDRSASNKALFFEAIYDIFRTFTAALMTQAAATA